ncbi:NAD-dependent histone deacetylase SIR2 [Exophiala viscosa]|uniref:tRNA (guanine(10)-N(2))-methyltransferase n=1 Tax=Exophiala viscosa TaxID=2486360 RepID=A0AAN6E211_9EURO|nr:NAD-dependent histone deacetylase SIR2 [Exophiala viscosa]KAI1629733.1 NAD-dependent histone deacetylase SIR2 [Exophiala viscosa]
MDYLIRLTQTHESFRRAEIEALSSLAGITCEIVSYAEESPFCIVRFSGLSGQSTALDDHSIDEVVRDFQSRAILSKYIYELWGQGQNYDQLRADVKVRSQHLWHKFEHVSFKFSVDSYGSTHDPSQQRQIIDSFSYLDFQGKIKMKNPEAEFAVLEEWLPLACEQDQKTAGLANGTAIDPIAGSSLRRVFLGRKIGESRRWLREKHDLKKRPYISTTSMDAELALLTANMALATSGKIFLDPFVGTGGFMVAAAELGAVVLGSDIDGRSFRGKGLGLEKGVGANFRKYGLSHLFGDCITSDLTNTPFRNSVNTTVYSSGRWLDGIICDPPYGVREGLKVLGTRKAVDASFTDNVEASVHHGTPVPHLINGIPAHTLPGYIAPKKPYSFFRMLDDILDFAVRTLVDGGRLAFWMPSANENEFGEEEATLIPRHPHLQLKHECVQSFNRWSRRLLIYERLPGWLDLEPGITQSLRDRTDEGEIGRTADELNPFRKRYFEAFVDRTNGASR